MGVLFGLGDGPNGMVTEATARSTVISPWKGGPEMWRSAPMETLMSISTQPKKQISIWKRAPTEMPIPMS